MINSNIGKHVAAVARAVTESILERSRLAKEKYPDEYDRGYASGSRDCTLICPDHYSLKEVAYNDGALAAEWGRMFDVKS